MDLSFSTQEMEFNHIQLDDDDYHVQLDDEDDHVQLDDEDEHVQLDDDDDHIQLDDTEHPTAINRDDVSDVDPLQLHCEDDKVEQIHATTNISSLEMIKQLQRENLQLIDENQKLKAENSMLQTLNFKLQHRITQDNNNLVSFKGLDGYPSAEWLLRASQGANNSDYLFVKELVLVLWPNGVGNATVSGRGSNNPTGSKRTENAESSEAAESLSSVSSSSSTKSASTPSQLDPEKVTYIIGKNSSLTIRNF